MDVTNSAGTNDIIQENRYYPFGLNYEGPWLMNDVARDNKYQYNGKEWNDDFGLNWNDYGARYYDPAIGRWGQVDPMVEKFVGWSPYNYTLNNPIKFIDPDGREIQISYREDKNSEVLTVRYGEDGKLYDVKSGEEYKGDNTFFRSVKNTLDKLRSLDSKVASVINDLIKGDEKHTVSNFDYKNDGTAKEMKESYNIKSRESSNPKGSLTKFIPDRDRERMNDPNLTNEEILGHELKHAYNRKYGLSKTGYTDNKVPWEEVDGVNFQNVIREKQSNSPKTTFAGRDISNYLVEPKNYSNYKKE